MPGKSERAKKKQSQELRSEQERAVLALVETFERTWSERPKEDGNTQAATMSRAGISPQAFGKWKRGQSDPTIGHIVAVAFALGRRIDFNLRSLSDPRETLRVVTNEGAEVSDDVMVLAEELERLPEGPKQRILGHLEGLLAAHRAQRSPTGPDADQRGHGARGK